MSTTHDPLPCAYCGRPNNWCRATAARGICAACERAMIARHAGDGCGGAEPLPHAAGYPCPRPSTCQRPECLDADPCGAPAMLEPSADELATIAAADWSTAKRAGDEYARVGALVRYRAARRRARRPRGLAIIGCRVHGSTCRPVWHSPHADAERWALALRRGTAHHLDTYDADTLEALGLDPGRRDR
jgi:hypothetical protein